MVVGDPLYPLTKSGAAKVHQKAERERHQAEVGEDLLPVHWGQPFRRFEFDEQKIVEEQVCSEGFAEHEAVVADVDRLLPSTFTPWRPNSAASRAS
jgi:hypothetical protein